MLPSPYPSTDPWDSSKLVALSQLLRTVPRGRKGWERGQESSVALWDILYGNPEFPPPSPILHTRQRVQEWTFSSNSHFSLNPLCDLEAITELSGLFVICKLVITLLRRLCLGGMLQVQHGPSRRQPEHRYGYLRLHTGDAGPPA